MHLAYQEDDFAKGIRSGHLDNDEAVPTNSDAIARILQRMTSRADPVNEDEITQAAALLEKIIHSPHLAQKVSDHLDEIDNLVLALLELNIQRARGDGRPELARRSRICRQYFSSNRSFQ